MSAHSDRREGLARGAAFSTRALERHGVRAWHGDGPWTRVCRPQERSAVSVCTVDCTLYRLRRRGANRLGNCGKVSRTCLL